MSFRQIFNRANQLANSYVSGRGDPATEADLRRAQELIDEAASRWELPDPATDPNVAHRVPMTRERACRLLQVADGATAEDVTRAYRKVIVQHHPDHLATANPEDRHQAELRTQELNRAYAYLKDHIATR